jgi:hypothetical protein
VFPVRPEPSWCVIVDSCLSACAPLGCLVCSRCSLFCCKQRCGFATAPERSCFAGLGIVRIAAGATRVALVYGDRHGSGRNQPYLDAPSQPAPLTAHQRPFDDVQQQSRICFFLILDCSREKSTILNSEVGRWSPWTRRWRVNRILNKNRHLSFRLRLWQHSYSSSGFFRQAVVHSTVCVTSISGEENSVPECCTLRRWRRFCWFDL